MDVDVLNLERECYRQGFESVAGIDEAGRGCLAGPVRCPGLLGLGDHYTDEPRRAGRSTVVPSGS